MDLFRDIEYKSIQPRVNVNLRSAKSNSILAYASIFILAAIILSFFLLSINAR